MQIAVSVVLLAGAGLLTRTMVRLSDVDTGLRNRSDGSLNFMETFLFRDDGRFQVRSLAGVQ